VDVLRQHEISEADHRILNPFTDDQLITLGEICRLRPDVRQVDLASGKGEMLCRWAQRFGIRGLGIDLSEVFVSAARTRAVELGVADRVRFERGDAGAVTPGTAPVESDPYDVVSCIGATWIGGGLAGTIELMRPLLAEGGLLLVGEPYWREDPPPQAYQAEGVGPEDFTSLVGTLDRFEAAGTQLVEMVLADEAGWDRYTAGQWWTVSRWLDDNPDSPEAPAMREYLTDLRRSYLAYGRQYLGWGVFVLRAA